MCAPHRLHALVVPDLCQWLPPDIPDRRSRVQYAWRWVDIAVGLDVYRAIPQACTGIPALRSRLFNTNFDTFECHDIFFYSNRIHTGNMPPGSVKIVDLVQRLLET